MPHRNVIREYAADMTYHVYNRGVERRTIFEDSQDYGVFLNRLKLMLVNREELDEKDVPRQPIKSFYGQVELLAFCLMPNHFHLLLYQYTDDGVSEFMRTLSTSYTMYFNKRYQRDGALFQGRYKACRVDSDAYRLGISRYIHLNPVVLGRNPELFEYSSLRHFGAQDISWLAYDRVLEDFESYEHYMEFVRDYGEPEKYRRLQDIYDII